jgi:hypothetical protein
LRSNGTDSNHGFSWIGLPNPAIQNQQVIACCHFRQCAVDHARFKIGHLNGQTPQRDFRFTLIREILPQYLNFT